MPDDTKTIAPVQDEAIELAEVSYEEGDAELAKPLDKPILQKAIHVAVAVVIALVSFFFLGDIASNPETYAGTMETLDAKEDSALGLVGAAMAASAAIALVPGDATTPIANELANLSSDFAIIFTAILLMKYLLTILGAVSFKLIIPVACGLHVFETITSLTRGQLSHLAVKLCVLAVLLIAVVPASAALSQQIDETFEYNAQLAALEEEGATAEPENAEGAQEDGEEGGVLEAIGGFFSSAGKAVADTTSATVDKATGTLSYLLEAFAVMIVTTCAVPILVLLAMVWAVNMLFGVNTSGASSAIKSRSWRKPMSDKRNQAAAALSDVKNSVKKAE